MFSSLKPKSEFSRNVLTLMTGTTIAQAIPIAISPILTRIYTPEDFGVLALYMSVASILSVAATGRYEMAIMLPKKEEDAINIVVLSIAISLFVSFLSLIIISVFNSQITNLLGNPDISNWLYFIPVTVLLTGVYQSLNYWSNRKKQYKRLAVSRVVQSGTAATVNLGMGFSGFGSSGLIVGSVVGQAIVTSILSKMIWNEDKAKSHFINRLKILAMARRYVKFPKYDIFASLSNVSAHQITHILFNALFNSTIAGYFYLTQKILSLPITFIASTISDVFRQSATKEYQQFGNAKKIYVSTFKKLFVLSFFPSLILYLYSVELFVFIFGEQWSVAGEYAKILVPMLFLKFISSPLSFMLYIAEKQAINMYSQFLFLFSIFIGFLIGDNEYEVITYISWLFSCIYLHYMYLSAKIAKLF